MGIQGLVAAALLVVNPSVDSKLLTRLSDGTEYVGRRLHEKRGSRAWLGEPTYGEAVQRSRELGRCAEDQLLLTMGACPMLSGFSYPAEAYADEVSDTLGGMWDDGIRGMYPGIEPRIQGVFDRTLTLVSRPFKGDPEEKPRKQDAQARKRPWRFSGEPRLRSPDDGWANLRLTARKGNARIRYEVGEERHRAELSWVLDRTNKRHPYQMDASLQCASEFRRDVGRHDAVVHVGYRLKF